MSRKPEYWAICTGHSPAIRHPIFADPGDVGVSVQFADFANKHRAISCSCLLENQAHVLEDALDGSWADIIRKEEFKPACRLIRDAFLVASLGLSVAAPDLDFGRIWTPNAEGRPVAAYRDERLWIPPLAYRDNADVKEAFQSIQTLTITNFSSLATSATAGWQSAQIDNTTNLYSETLMQFTNTAVNTAPANSKAIYFYAFGGLASGTLTDFGAAVTGTGEATLTFADITANSIQGLCYVQPYPTQNKALVSSPFSMAIPFGGSLPSYWGVAAINHSGMTLGTVTMKYQGGYQTVI